MSIKFQRENSETHIAFNTENEKTCTINKITHLTSPLTLEEAKWRVDYNGETVDTMILGLKRAKKLARDIIK